ncbi:hypothetical protein MKW94_011982 [Papaver nudicaule]|uniref:SCP domain-containing protein n=1 Tax=Papaver nudicaule TaxID=74823 RepID=A0AA42AW89_PAPNU|nr:hypothetical protein [Papaver nudicaule]
MQRSTKDYKMRYPNEFFLQRLDFLLSLFNFSWSYELHVWRANRQTIDGSFTSMGRFHHVKLGSSVPPMSLLIIITLFLLIHTSQGSPTPKRYLKTLQRHNAARAAVGVPHLEWNKTIAAYARRWARKRKADCRPLHSTGGYYGENLALGPWGGPFPVEDAVNMWVSEKQYYDHGSNSCYAPPNQSCGHYTAIVCRRTTHVGCAKTVCRNGGIFIICDYGPPGKLGEPPY